MARSKPRGSTSGAGTRPRSIIAIRSRISSSRTRARTSVRTMTNANAPTITVVGIRNGPYTKTSSTAPPGGWLEVIRLAPLPNCFTAGRRVELETFSGGACSNTVADGGCQRARARRALPFRRRDRVPGPGRSAQRPRIRPDRADGAGSIARRRSGAGSISARAPRAAVLPRRGAPLDVDLPHRRERLRARCGAAGGAVARRRARGETAAAVGDGPAIRRLRAARSAREGDRAAAGELPVPDRGALSGGRALRGSRGGARSAARHGEDAAVSREAAAAATARDGSAVTRRTREKAKTRRLRRLCFATKRSTQWKRSR